MKILLTGANDQLGRALQMPLKHHHVVALAHDQIDITQLDQVLASVQYHRPRLAINAAAFNDVDGTESRCDEDFRINAVGPRNLAVATAAHGVPLLHLSTDYVAELQVTSRGIQHLQETIVPKPVLSTNCSSHISKITLGLAVSTGAMPRLNAGDWLASSLGPGTMITVTSPI
jgi:dTDP-4-dehydrorhamnose reductase